MTTAIVVGSGPNGLAAAIRLAQHGVAVTVLEGAAHTGGGLHTTERDGVRHDDCATALPMAAASPFLRSLRLERHGLRWLHHEAVLAHPFDDADAALLWRDVHRTSAELDDTSWERVFAPLTLTPEALFASALAPVLRMPRHPVVLARLGVRAAMPASLLRRALRTDRARALFGGVAAHAFGRLDTPFSSAPGTMLIAAAHTHGFPIAAGGAGALSDALLAELHSLGGRVETGRPVSDLAELDADLVLLSVAPRTAAAMLAGRVPNHVARAWRRFRPGPAAFKVDVTVDGPVPWRDERCAAAGVLHLGGAFEEVAAAEADTVRGRMPARPFVLAAQPHAADPSRSSGDRRPLWLYAHVPNGWAGDAAEAVLAQVERFAPGFRRVVRDVHVRSPAALEADNPVFLGGDIGGGANTMRQLIARPRTGTNGYRTGVPGVYLCGASTSPGGGVHGMAGFHAAETALGDLRR